MANADVKFVIDSIGAWEKFKVESHFDPPLVIGNAVAQLSGSIRSPRSRRRRLRPPSG